tara:strand:+ start:236 stop:346 length:111 start_codon:yes stop_codon:yes gene_type:complete
MGKINKVVKKADKKDEREMRNICFKEKKSSEKYMIR